MNNTKKLVILSLFISQALVLSYIENWLPAPTNYPGVKLGLANIITMVVLSFFGIKEALLVTIIRVTLSSFFTGGFSVFLFSMAGGLLSTIIMAVFLKYLNKHFSFLGISIMGSLAHNIAQLGVASIVMKEIAVMMYLPVLLISAIVMGVFIGLISNFLVKALNKTGIIKSF